MSERGGVSLIVPITRRTEDGGGQKLDGRRRGGCLKALSVTQNRPVHQCAANAPPPPLPLGPVQLDDLARAHPVQGGEGGRGALPGWSLAAH